MKKLGRSFTSISLLLLCVLILTACGYTKHYGKLDKATGFRYLEIDGGYAVTEYEGKDTEVVIPSEFKGLPVLEIGAEYDDRIIFFLQGNRDKNVTKVTIAKSIKRINKSAFSGNNNLTEVVFENESQLESIGDSAFHFCTGLKDIILPPSLKSIEKLAFNGCSGFENIILPEGVETIGNNAYSGCGTIKTIVFPKSLIRTGSDIFRNVNPEEMVVPFVGESRTSDNGFYYWYIVMNETIAGQKTTSRLKKLTIFDTPIINASVFNKFENNITTLRINKTDTFVSGGALSKLTSLEKLIIPDLFKSLNSGVRTLGYGFNATVAISSQNNYIPSSLKSVTLTHATQLDDNAFQGCSNLTEIVLPPTVKKISSGAFAGCTALMQINLPEGIEVISASAFKECRRLQQITLPTTIKTIESNAFDGCYDLNNINIPQGVQTIGKRAFYGCVGLKNITIPQTVTTMGDEVFQNCTGLTIKVENYSAAPAGWSSSWNPSNRPVVWK